MMLGAARTSPIVLGDAAATASPVCMDWARAHYDFDGYRRILRGEIASLLAGVPIAPRVGSATGNAIRADRWVEYVRSVTRWMVAARVQLERLASKINLPRYWLTWQVPPMHVGTLTLHCSRLFHFFPKGIDTVDAGQQLAQLEAFYRSARTTPTTIGGVSALLVSRVINYRYTAGSMAQMRVADPMREDGIRFIEPGDTASLEWPSPMDHVEIVANILRYVSGRPIDPLFHAASDEWARLIGEALEHQHPSQAAELKAAIAAGAGVAAGVATAIPVYGPAISAALACFSALAAIFPLAVADPVCFGRRDAIDGQLHFALCFLGARGAAGWVPDPFLFHPPAECGSLSSGGVMIPPAPTLLFAPTQTQGSPPKDEDALPKRTSTATLVVGGITLAGIAAAIGLALARR